MLLLSLRPTEPITTLTDYALAVAALIFAGVLLQNGQTAQQRSIQGWAGAFAGVALAAGLGGTCHGFGRQLGEPLTTQLWHGMIYSLSWVSVGMLIATGISTLPRPIRRWLWFAVGVKSVGYWLWLTAHPSFAAAVVDYLLAMTLVLIAQLWILLRQRPNAGSARWILAEIGVSVGAIGIEAASLQFPAPFNAHDGYHLVQLAGLGLFYQGAHQLRDC